MRLLPLRLLDVAGLAAAAATAAFGRTGLASDFSSSCCIREGGRNGGITGGHANTHDHSEACSQHAGVILVAAETQSRHGKALQSTVQSGCVRVCAVPIRVSSLLVPSLLVRSVTVSVRLCAEVSLVSVCRAAQTERSGGDDAASQRIASVPRSDDHPTPV